MANVTVAGITFDPTNINNLKNADLTAIYNKLAGKSIKKFTDLAEGRKRLAPLLVNLIREDKKANDTHKPDGTNSGKRRSPMPNHHVIHLKVDGNPKVAGSSAAKMWDLYKDQMTVSQAYSSGITPADIRYNKEHGFIEVKPAEPPKFVVHPPVK